MSLKKRDKEFRTPKVTYLDFKHIEMDRVLTMLFPRLKYEGYAGRFRRSTPLTVDDFVNEFVEHNEWFKGFEDHREIAYRWVETDLLDLVSRGRAKQAVAAPRPLHGNTYKFRNAKHTRDYGAAEQLYWMLYFARKGKGQSARDALKQYFFTGYDFVTDKYDEDLKVDVETQAILRLDHQVTQDTKSSEEPERHRPLCVGQADILADDILRLLTYERHVPRSVLVDYLKTLMSFHLALYHLRLLVLLPWFVKQHSVSPSCTAGTCPIDPSLHNAMEGCPYQLKLVVDMGDAPGSHMAELSRRSLEDLYRRIPTFVQSNFIVKRLDEMADYLGRKTNKIPIPPSGDFSVDDLVRLLRPELDSERNKYFGSRMASLIEAAETNDGQVDPQITAITSMGLDDFETYIEILMAYRGKYHRQYIVESLDSLLMKNKETGMLAQSRSKGSPRRFAMGSKLLEVLLQIAVLTQRDGAFVTREIRVDELLGFLRHRYGIHIDRLGHDSVSTTDLSALRANTESFKLRLREIGFYQDLSDAYVTQKITPRYTIGSIA